MKILGIISRILTGLVFTFSGFVKVVDPLGTAYKFTDYFTDAFYMPILEPLSLPMAIVMSAMELAIGLMLIFNLKHKIAAWGALLLMAFFTPLTLYLAISDAVHDCGCFGDALVLSNWETFWKNVIISGVLLTFFFMRNKLQSNLKNYIQWIIIALIFIFSFGFEFFNYTHLPVIDFRAYKVGTNIPEDMKLPEDAVKDEYKTTLVYKNSKTDEVKEFSEEDYPWDDSIWVWQDTKSVLIKEGDKAKISGFSISSIEDGSDLTQDILENELPVLLIIAYNLNKTSESGLKKTYQKIDELKKSGDYKTYLITSSLQSQIDSISKIVEPNEIEFCIADEIVLKTIVRANPGLLLLENGTIKEKWHYNKLK